MSGDPRPKKPDTTRLTIELPWELHKELKMQAVMDGCSLRELVLAAIRKEYNLEGRGEGYATESNR